MKFFRSYRKFIFLTFFILSFFFLENLINPTEVYATNRFNGDVIDGETFTRLSPPDVAVSCGSGCNIDFWVDNHFDATHDGVGNAFIVHLSDYPSEYVGCTHEIWDRGADIDDPGDDGETITGEGCDVSFTPAYSNDWRYGIRFLLHLPPPDLGCTVTASAQCINDGNQIELTWDLTTDPGLVWDQFIIRGADQRTPDWWVCPTCIWYSTGVGNLEVRSAIFDVVENAAGPPNRDAESGVEYRYTIKVNDGCVWISDDHCDYTHPDAIKCASNAVFHTCTLPAPTPTPTPIPCEPGGDCCICIRESRGGSQPGVEECNLLADFCNKDQGLVGECTTSLDQCEESTGCNCVPAPEVICGDEGQPCCLPDNDCPARSGLYCDRFVNICRAIFVAGPLTAFCIGSSGPVADPSEGTIYTAIGCIPTRNTQLFIQFYLRWGMGLAGGIALVLIVVSGFMIITAQGDPQKLKAAKQLLASAVTGMALLLFSAYLMRLIGTDILNIPGL